MEKQLSNKNYTTAVILSGIFGVIGIHHLYLERWTMFLLDFGLFIAMLILLVDEQLFYAYLVLSIDVIHTVIVTYLLLIGKYKDGEGKIIPFPGQNIN